MLSLSKNEKLKLFATVLAGSGAYFMGYLTRIHYLDTGSSVCDISAELSCEIVNKSAFSELFGIPVAILGLLFFLSIPYLLYVKPFKKPWRIVLLASVFSLVFGLYLSWLEHTVINSICIFCESSKIVMVALIGVSAYAMRREKEEFKKEWIIGAVLVGVLFSFIAYSLQKEPVLQKDYTAIAQCLTEQNVYEYGAFACPHCADQKRLFGPAFEEINYVECDPRTKPNEAERCIAANIPGTPTWIQESPEGEVLKSLPGVFTPEELATEFGCEDSIEDIEL